MRKIVQVFMYSVISVMYFQNSEAWCLCLTCFWRANLRLVLYSQYWQEKGFSPVWISICLWTTWHETMFLEHLGQAHLPLVSLIGTFWNKKIRMIVFQSKCFRNDNVQLLGRIFRTFALLLNVYLLNHAYQW